MRRFCCTLVVFTVCIGTVVGCRRVDGVQRKPTPNHIEEDMLPGRRDDETSLHARPKERRTLVYAVPVRDIEQKMKIGEIRDDPKQYWRKIGASQKAMEEDKEKAEAVGKMKENTEKADRIDEFLSFGKACKEYVTARPAKEWTEENALKWFRRELKFYPKKWLDSVEGEIKIERYWYHDFIAQKTATFVPFVDFKDFDPNFPYIMCSTESTAGGGGMMMGGGGGGGGGDNAIYHNLKSDKIDSKSFRSRVLNQEMRILYLNFARYSAPLDARKGQFPTYDGFMKHLREYAPGQLLQDIDDKVIYVHKPADGILGTGNLACRTDPAYLTISGSSPVPFSSGNPFPGVKIPQPTKKNTKEEGMPGMPGMPR
jgi:hypothetical protein